MKLYITQHGVAEKSEKAKEYIFSFIEGTWKVPKENKPLFIETKTLKKTRMFAKNDFSKMLNRYTK